MKKAIVSIGAAVAALLANAGFDPANLQRMIDEASANGGGTVVVPKGDWETGPLALRSNVTLHLDKGVRLLGDTDPSVYRKAKLPALVHAENAENVAIEGEGVLDGRGGFMPSSSSRPHLVNFFSCRNVRVEGVTLRCGGSWTLNPKRCDGVVIRGVKIWGHVNHCQDGMDISSKNVLIEDCDVDSDDDALVFKTPAKDIEVENVVVRNCRLRSSCNAIKFGTETHGLMRNISISDCEIGPPSAQGRFDWRKDSQGITNYLTGLAGIAVECVDGGMLDGVKIRNIRMSGMQTPIFVRLGRRHEPQNGEESFLRNVLIENVTATAESRIACSITGVPGLRPKNVAIRNVTLNLPGEATLEDTMFPVPEKEDRYPDAHMFDGQVLPAHAFYVRHADGVRIENLSVRLAAEDARPAIVVDDAEVATDFTDVVRKDAGSDERSKEMVWSGITRPFGYFFCPLPANGKKPPLVVWPGATPQRHPEHILAECRKRGWAMLAPFARDAKGVLAALDSVADRVDADRIYVKGDGGCASVALEMLAEAPTRFAGVSAVMPTRPVRNLIAARGVPVDLATALENPRVDVAIDSFTALVGDAAIPDEVAGAIKGKGKVPPAFRFAGIDGDFPKKSRPLAYQAKVGNSRLSVVKGKTVAMLVPSFTWFDRLLARSADGKRRLILAGDSTMAHRAPTAKQGSWGEALANDLADDVEIVNCAIGGRSTKTYMDEWKTNVVGRIRPGDWVLIQFGHNDMSKASDPKVDRQTDPDTEYMNNLLRFVADVRRCGGQPLLVTPITLYLYNRDPGKWPEKNPLARWVAAMKRVAREFDVPIVDLNSLSLAAVRDAGSAVSAKWYMFSEDGKDWAHPTRLGAAKIAALFVDHVRTNSQHRAKSLLKSTL